MHRVAFVVLALGACRRTAVPSTSVAHASVARDTAVVTAASEVAAPSLPRPYHTPSAEHPARIVARPDGAQLRVANGWTISQWATTPGRVRQLLVAPDSTVLATDSEGGSVLVYRDANGDGRAEEPARFVSGLDLPFALALHPRGGELFVACTGAVVRFAYNPGQWRPIRSQQLVALPGRGYNQHWTRSLAISQDGSTVFVSVGSETNNDVEADPRRGAITACDLDGRCRVYASGLRNATGLAIEPSSGALIAAVNERDGLGDELVPDYLTRVREGAFYGWPYAYFGPHEDPRRAGERPDLVARTVTPDLSLGAHVAPISVLFPRALRGDALVTLHGSWNRSNLVGYSVVRVRFSSGIPRSIEPFVDGWVLDAERAWGRPAGMAEGPDGAIYVADDGAHALWKLTPS